MDILTPLTIGVVGSLHCLGMCGPIVVALPLRNHRLLSKVSGALLYNSGRVITYGMIGILFGLIGHSLNLAGFQQLTSIILGILLILSIIIPAWFKFKLKIGGFLSKSVSRITQLLRRYLDRRSHSSLFVIGILNGLLPCGLVYVAVAGAISTGNVFFGATFMMLFGLGTIPMLMTAALASNFIGQQLRAKMQKIVPYFIFLIGILFILRGLSLGIPYISPTTEKLAPKEMIEKGSCCK